MKSSDSDDIYDLMLGQLKKALKTEEPNLKAISLALDFCKMFGLQEEMISEDLGFLIESLPFKNKDEE